MKIEQKPKFQPITITLETAEEAEGFWGIVSGENLNSASKKLAIKISNWLTEKAQLGGDK